MKIIKINTTDEAILRENEISIFNGENTLNYELGSLVKISEHLIAEQYSRSPNHKILTQGAFSYCVSGDMSLMNIKIGRFSSIAAGVRIADGHHPIHALSSSPYSYGPWYKKNLQKAIRYNGKPVHFQHSYGTVIVGNDVWIGSNVTLKAGISVGDGAVIASNSVVIKDVESYQIVGGNPARFIKNRFEDRVIESLMEYQFWNKDIKDIKDMNWENVEECIEVLSGLTKSTANYKKIILNHGVLNEI